MRLTYHERSVIKAILIKHFGSDSKILLFGSRIDNTKRGGDIDLLVESNLPSVELIRKKLEAVSEIQLVLGDRKIDLVTYQIGSSDSDCPVIVNEARATGVLL